EIGADRRNGPVDQVAEIAKITAAPVAGRPDSVERYAQTGPLLLHAARGIRRDDKPHRPAGRAKCVIAGPERTVRKFTAVFGFDDALEGDGLTFRQNQYRWNSAGAGSVAERGFQCLFGSAVKAERGQDGRIRRRLSYVRLAEVIPKLLLDAVLLR